MINVDEFMGVCGFCVMMALIGGDRDKFQYIYTI